VSLNGATVRNDLDDNQALYGRKMTNKEVIMSDLKPPATAMPLIHELDKYSMRSNADRSKDH
ncbi:MAG TPA: YSC84-related protein, partial [Bryobacteraceae bacterium]|nr:YSC84-related protein [Bryobacteraceae bacterium]